MGVVIDIDAVKGIVEERICNRLKAGMLMAPFIPCVYGTEISAHFLCTGYNFFWHMPAMIWAQEITRLCGEDTELSPKEPVQPVAPPAAPAQPPYTRRAGTPYQLRLLPGTNPHPHREHGHA